MNRLYKILDLQGKPFAKQVEAAFVADPYNEEDAAQILANLVFAAQTKGALGEAAMAVFDYDGAKDWLQTLFVAAISHASNQYAEAGFSIERFFFEAWIESGRTRALTDLIATLPAHQVATLFSADASNEEVLTLYRLAVTRHIVAMTEQYPHLLPEEGLFAQLV